MQRFENVGNKNGLKPDIWASIQFSGDNLWCMPLIKHHPWAKLLNYRSLCRRLISQFHLKKQNKQKKKGKKLLYTLQQLLRTTKPFPFWRVLTLFSTSSFLIVFLTFSSKFLQSSRLKSVLCSWFFLIERECLPFAGSSVAVLYNRGARMGNKHLFRGEAALLVPCLWSFDADRKLVILVTL